MNFLFIWEELQVTKPNYFWVIVLFLTKGRVQAVHDDLKTKEEAKRIGLKNYSDL